jgi:hypothetical protein
MANTAAYRLPDGRMAVDVDTNKTLTIDDSGFVQNVIADAVVVTLPATATHGTFIVRNGGDNATGTPYGAGADGSAKVSVSPNASDRIQGGVGGTATDDKDLINTKATSRVGDEVVVENRAETNGPIVMSIKGIWARE